MFSTFERILCNAVHVVLCVDWCRTLVCATSSVHYYCVCTVRKISSSYIKFLVYVIIILRSLFYLFHVMEVAYNGGGCLYFIKSPSRTLITVSAF